VPLGIEISSKLAESADRAFAPRGGYAINLACVAGLRRFPESFFAAASLRSYLEHEADPLPVLTELRSVLAPNAFAIIKVPNYGSPNCIAMGRRWCGFRYPDHLNYVSPGTVRAMAKGRFRNQLWPDRPLADQRQHVGGADQMTIQRGLPTPCAALS
jgi:SAM-dependent methyltransferase